MTKNQNGPPEKEVGPDATNARANTEEALATTPPDDAEFTCTTGRCAYGTVCNCAFYADYWSVVWQAAHTESVSVQLRRRRAASWRCPRLTCGQRDPISESAW